MFFLPSISTFPEQALVVAEVDGRRVYGLWWNNPEGSVDRVFLDIGHTPIDAS